jgi:hypothetical protein
MIYISHRGNIDGSIPEKENHPDYIYNALDLGYKVEIDVWLVNNSILLGHDKPQYKIDENFLTNKDLWIHAKNYEAFEFLYNYDIRYFWHTVEDLVLTSKKDIWTYPGNPLVKNSIAVLPETVSYSTKDLKKCYGICSNYIRTFKELME